MGEKSHAKESARIFLGLSFLSLFVLILVSFKPRLDHFLPAANLAYLLRDGRYLILFQNNNELRASGGFIGSFAEVEVAGGRPGSINFGTNIYKLDEPFVAQFTVLPPPPLQRITQGKWAFRDSNWAADFPEAARQVLWFYEREWAVAGEEKKIDGVIALTTTVIEELLRLTGPIEMPAYATTLAADNFAEVVQFKVEKEYYQNRANWPVEEPKTILRDLIPILEERVKKVDKKALVDLVFRLLDEKFIILFSKNPLAERVILAQDWGGRVDPTSGNYLYIVNSNVDGGKSSRKINERVRYNLDRTNRVVNLYIEREHTGSGLWPDDVNRNWMRVLVPKGSKLIAARMALKNETPNVDIGEEAGKTVFGLWMNTNPKETQDLTIVFSLPPKISLSPLIVQRQPGANPDWVTVSVDGKEVFQGQVRDDLRLSF